MNSGPSCKDPHIDPHVARPNPGGAQPALLPAARHHAGGRHRVRAKPDTAERKGGVRDTCCCRCTRHSTGISHEKARVLSQNLESESPAPRAGVSSRRKAFGGKLTNSEDPPSNAASTSSHRNRHRRQRPPPPDAGIHDAHDPTDVAAVERLLNEWTLVDSASQDPLNLHLTDEEAGSDAEAGPHIHAATRRFRCT